MSNIFGQTCSYNKARLVLLGVPWEVTVSYASGTVHGPQWIQQASSQLDFFDPQTQQNPSQEGLHFQYLKSLKTQNDQLRSIFLKSKKSCPTKNNQLINQECLKMIQTIKEHTKKILDDKKLFGMIGGDHSISEGALLEIGRRTKGNFGLLHFDAHADMRSSYQGWKHSHASVMYNILHQTNSPKTIVQVGIRDLCEEEHQIISSHSHIHCFFDHEIKQQLFEGKTWSFIVEKIIRKLPKKVYISFDIDALSWTYAPNTGSPVPGGLSFDQVSFFIQQLAKHKKEIIGFDLVEVARPTSKDFGEWDGNVGARLIYKLCGLSLFQKSNQ